MRTPKCPSCKSFSCIRKGVRRGCLKYLCKDCHQWFQLNRGKRKIKPLDALMQHLGGYSYRTLGEMAGVSAPTAYRYSKLAQDRLAHCVDITRKYCTHFCGILLVDGKYLSVGDRDRKVPVIYGIDYLTHDIPHYRLAKSENYLSCLNFFRSLRLANYPLSALVCDDNVNIRDACLKIYPKTTVQLCQNHYKENIRHLLRVRTDDTHVTFVKDLEFLFKKKLPLAEFDRLAERILLKHQADPVRVSIMLDIEKRKPYLLAYTQNKAIPRTNNLIELYNSHLEGRLKTIKGFDSFPHADTWLNAYFIRRRLKPFTSCSGKFKYLNKKSSLQVSTGGLNLKTVICPRSVKTR